MTDRLALDQRVINELSAATDLFAHTPFSSLAALRSGQQLTAGAIPRAYRIDFRIPTLIGEGPLGQGQFAESTTMAVDLGTVGYPLSPPNVIVLTELPYSPHFMQNRPVCIGSEAWADKAGHVTLGHLVIHLAKLLNWDEEMRGGGYVGWNGQAIEFHKAKFGGPLNPDLTYPAIPAFLHGGGTFKRTDGFGLKKKSFAPRT